MIYILGKLVIIQCTQQKNQIKKAPTYEMQL